MAEPSSRAYICALIALLRRAPSVPLTPSLRSLIGYVGRSPPFSSRLTVHPVLCIQPLHPSAQHGPTQDSKIIVWAHNSHVGDVRATELHSAHGARATATDLQAATVRGLAQVGPKWSLGHLMRETFGREAVYSIAFSTYGGSVTASPKWGDPAHCFELRPAIPGSVGETLHQALPHVRAIHAAPAARGILCFFSDRGAEPTTQAGQPQRPGQTRGTGAADQRLGKHLGSVWGRGDPAAAADEAAAEAAKAEALLETLGSKQLRAARTRTLQKALGPMRPFRAVGVNYKRDDEMRAHYIQTRLPDLADALIHIDMTDALMPLDLTPEWVAGHQQIQQAAMHAQAKAAGFSSWEEYQKARQRQQRQQEQQGQQAWQSQQPPESLTQGDHLMRRKAAAQRGRNLRG